eukprot:424629_1
MAANNMTTAQRITWVEENQGTIRKYTEDSYKDNGQLIVVPPDAQLDGAQVDVVFVNGGKQRICKPYVQELHEKTEVIKQLKLTEDIPGLPSAKVGNVIDFRDSTFELTGDDPKSLKPFTVAVRKCPNENQRQTVSDVQLEWFQMFNPKKPGDPHNCRELEPDEKKDYTHLLESSPTRLYYPAVIGRRDGRNAGHAVANWVDPYAWYRVFY